MNSELSTFDKMMLFSRKFLIPIVFVLLGGFFVYLALTTRVGEYNQQVDGVLKVSTMANDSIDGADRTEGANTSMVIGAITCLVVALVSLLIVMGKIKKSVGSILAILFIPIIGFVCYRLWTSITDYTANTEKRELIKEEIKLRLMDVRDAQQAYKREKGEFTNNFDELIDFVKTGKKSKVIKFGSPLKRRINPEELAYLYGDDRAVDFNMSEIEAYRLSKSPICPAELKNFKRDTVYVSVLDEVFNTDGKVEARQKQSLYKEFIPDSLRYIPFTGAQEFDMQFDTINYPVKAAVFKIEVLHDFLKQFDDTLRIGNLKKLDLSGNWEL
jgi:hypothetical protein